MGLSHSHLEDGSGGTFNFSTGYGVEGQFVTVMAYPAAFQRSDTGVCLFQSLVGLLWVSPAVSMQSMSLAPTPCSR